MLGVGFMAVMAVIIWTVPELLVWPFLSNTTSDDNARVMALACSYAKEFTLAHARLCR